MYEACKRCKWWDETEVQPDEERFGECYARPNNNMNDGSEYYWTSSDARCPQFTPLPSNDLQPDVCPGCKKAARALGMISAMIHQLASRRLSEADKMRFCASVSKLVGAVVNGEDNE